MSKKLLKRNCWVLVRSQNGYRKPYVNVLGVFNKQKEAQEYLKWLNPKDTENYDIRPSKRFVYVNKWEKELENEKDNT